ncbi:putative pectinesterase/pectinesterase inhibitor 45 [Tanacetum coccineum]
MWTEEKGVRAQCQGKAQAVLVTATLSLAAACSSAGIVVLYARDLDFCNNPKMHLPCGSSQADDPDEDVDNTENINNDKNNDNKDLNKGKSSDAGNEDQKVVQTQKAVKTICQSTDYKETCESGIEKSLSTKSKGFPGPNDFVNAAISAASDEFDNAITQTAEFMKAETAPPNQKPTFDVCKQVFEDAQNDFNHTKNATMGSTTSHDVRNWLSAVMTYQQTCIDALAEDATRTSIEQALKTTKEMTSNSLAIVSSFNKDAPSPGPASHRRLLSSADNDFPVWMARNTRRLLKADTPSLKPNVTVAKDGSGNFVTISKALEALPEDYQGRYVIHIKGGVYEENVVITKNMVNITMYGDGSQKTIVTGNKNFKDGVPTFLTATFAAIGEGFMAQSMGFRNTAGPEKAPAVALRVQSDQSVFLNCRMEGFQNTLYAQTHRQFYRGCDILGTIDFIFGDAAAIFQTCDILIRKPMVNQQNTVTAQGRIDKHETTGFVLQKCKISADPSLGPEKVKTASYLGRPIKEFSRTVVMESEIDNVIRPEGWLSLEGDFAVQTLYYAEYSNIGPGSRVKDRVKWAGYQTNFKKEEAAKYTVSQFIQGERWLKGVDVPVHLGLYS